MAVDDLDGDVVCVDAAVCAAQGVHDVCVDPEGVVSSAGVGARLEAVAPVDGCGGVSIAVRVDAPVDAPADWCLGRDTSLADSSVVGDSGMHDDESSPACTSFPIRSRCRETVRALRSR